MLASCVGYCLRAWASKRLDASTLVLYNAAQPPITALLGLLVDPTKRYDWAQAGGTLLVLIALMFSSGVCEQLYSRRSANGPMCVEPSAE